MPAAWFAQALMAVPLKNDGVGQWRSTFSEQDKADFKAEAGELLVRMGYETDDNW